MNTQPLTTVLITAIQAAGYALWGYEWIGGGEHRCLRVYIDDPDGISIDDCAIASQHISAALAVDDPDLNYQLEVSSPGLDRRLYELAHYKRYIGYEIKLQLRAPDLTGQRRFRGVIESVTEDGSVILNTEQGDYEFTVNNIEQARLAVQWTK